MRENILGRGQEARSQTRRRGRRRTEKEKVVNKAKNTTPSSPLITIINGYQRQYSWSDRRGENVLFCVHTFIMFLTKTEDQNSRVLTWERSDSKR